MHPDPRESSNLSWEAEQRRKAKRYDEKLLETVETAVHDIAELKLWRSSLTGKISVIAILGSIIASFIFHMLTQYFGLHR